MSWVIWITGLPGSGKSTIAARLRQRRPDSVLLSMDEFRKVVTPKPDYSENEREYLYRSIVFTAQTAYDLGHNVIIDATANRRRWRDLAREMIPGFCEVYLDCPLETCIRRERARADTYGAPAGIYEKAKEGFPVPGISAPFEEPQAPELIIHTDTESPEKAVEKVVRMLNERNG